MPTTSLCAKLRSFWAGYLFLFDEKPQAPYPANVGVRILVTCLLLEGMIRPALRGVIFGSGDTSLVWKGLVLVTTMQMLAVGLTWCWIRLPFQCIGFYNWHQWKSTEKWFFPQVLLIGLFVHAIIQWTILGRLLQRPDWVGTTILVLTWQMMWGFYQEYVYRGLLQTELVRRWGAFTGILVSNVLFTFGPLHAYHLWIGVDHPNHLFIFVAIFAIGLYFGILFHTSKNLWIIGVLHGLGDFFIDGLPVLNGASIRPGWL